MPRILLVTGIFLVPVIFDRGTAEPFNAPKITSLWVLVVSSAGLWLMEVIQGRVRPVPFRLGVFGGLVVAAFAVATVFSRTPVVSLFGWHSRTTGFLTYALYASIFFLIAQLYWRRPERLKEVIYALGAAASIAVVYIVVQRLRLDPFQWTRPKHGGLNYFGTVGNTNFAGGYLGATSPWLLLAFWRARRLRWRALVLAWSAVTIVALLMTESRGGLLAFIAAAGVATIVFRSRLPRWVLIGGAIVAVVTALAAAVVVVRPTITRPEVAVPGQRDVLRTETLEIRSFWWRASLKIFADNPIVGTGPDTFVVVFPRYMDPAGAGKVERGPGVEASDSPHNVFLAHAAQMGLLGVGTFIALIAAAAWWGLRRMGQADRPEGDLLGTSLAIVGGYTGQALFSIDVAPVAMLVWVGVGGVAALADPRLVALRSRGHAPTTQAPRMTALRWTAVGLVALLTAGAAVGGTRLWRADRMIKEAREAEKADDFESAGLLRDRAVKLYPLDAVTPLTAGSALLRQASELRGEEKRRVLRDVISYFERADDIQPGFHLVKLAIGEAKSRLGAAGELSAFYDASVAFEDAAELAPHDWRVLTRYADMLNRWGTAEGRPERHCLALDKLRQAFGLRSGDPKTWRSLAVTYTHLGQFDRALEALQRSLIIDSENPETFRLRETILAVRARGQTPVRSC